MDANSKRIARNTLFLYVRMVVLMFISIFTSRVLLEKLGIDDFGVYNVVGGITGLFAFFSSSLTNASQRFLSFELGRNDLKKANIVFNQHLILYLLIIGVVLLFAETLGLWFVYTKLVIPPDRLFAAVCVYHFTVASLCITLLGIVFNSCIVAHEAMDVFSFLGIIQGGAKLGIVYLLTVTSMDKLIVYSFLMLMVTLMIQAFYMLYCFKRYAECRFRWVWNKSVLKETGALVGWNIVGTAVNAVNDSGVNILINLFFGPAVNAARALSGQIGWAISSLSTNFYTSVQSPLTKAYAAADYNYMMQLFYKSSKYSFYLLWVICLPVMFCINELLSIWLVEVPEYVGGFTIWLMFSGMIGTLNNPIWTIMLAVGKLKRYILIGNGVFLLGFPISYVVLRLGYSPISVVIVMTVLRSIYLVVVLHIASTYIPVTRQEYMNYVVHPILKSVALSVVIVASFYYFMPTTLIGTMLYCVLAALITITCISMVGVTADERAFVLNFIKNRFIKR